MTRGPGQHRVGVVAELPPLLLEFGLDPKRLLVSAGLHPELLQDPENTISFGDLGRLFEEAAAATRCPHIGVLLGLRGGLQSLGLVGQLMATAPTVKDAILDLCANQVRYIDGAVTYLAMQNGVGLWGYMVQVPPLSGLPVILDCAMGIAVSMLKQLAGQRPEEVRLGRATPNDAARYRSTFRVPTSFDAEQTCTVLPPEVLAAPVHSADPQLRRILQRRVADYWARTRPGTTELVRRALAAQVTGGEPSLDTVALALGMAARTLNRKLQAEGTSFRAVLDQARHDVACQLLGGTRMAVTDIGASLGYATPAGFVRAFRRIAGEPPTAWRRAQSQHAG